MTFCLDADRKTLLAMLAHIVASSIDARVHSSLGRDAATDELAAVVGLDMAAWWSPSEAFFKRISKAQMATATEEAGCAPEIGKAIRGDTKAEAIQTALRALDGKGWVPSLLRTPALETSESDVVEAGGTGYATEEEQPIAAE